MIYFQMSLEGETDFSTFISKLPHNINSFSISLNDAQKTMDQLSFNSNIPKND